MAETNEAKALVFTEYRKQAGKDFGVFHLTVRDDTDEAVLKRLQWWDTQLTNMGFEHCDAPKGFGGGKGKPKQERAEIPADGKFMVKALSLFEYNNGKHIRAIGENGEECVSWGGAAIKALVTAGTAKDESLAGWEGWKKDEEHPINWSAHALQALCEKSSKNRWFLASLVVIQKQAG